MQLDTATSTHAGIVTQTAMRGARATLRWQQPGRRHGFAAIIGTDPSRYPHPTVPEHRDR